MAASETNEDDVIAAINITPFVDVVLVLLIIFMVTSSAIIKASLKVDLPKAATGGAAVPTTLNIVLTIENKLFLNGLEITEPKLLEETQKTVQTDPKTQAVIAADKGVAYGDVIHILDGIKRMGITSFALNVERESAP